MTEFSINSKILNCNQFKIPAYIIISNVFCQCSLIMGRKICTFNLIHYNWRFVLLGILLFIISMLTILTFRSKVLGTSNFETNMKQKVLKLFNKNIKSNFYEGSYERETE